MKTIQLKARRDASLLRRHPWIFSGAIGRKDPALRDGDLVQLLDAQGQIVATGHYQDSSIQVRIIAFEATDAGPAFWRDRLKKAWDYRQAAGILDLPETDCFRLIHAEGDGLPGLIIDIYGRTAVIQCHSIGMHRQIQTIADALTALLPGRIDTIYDKSTKALPQQYAQTVADGPLLGDAASGTVSEYGYRFRVNWQTGQKTGFFLDQRENRKLLERYVAGKTVLNAFCYTGGFSVYALGKGAARVDSVDVSAPAIALTDENVALNGGQERHRSYTQDVLKFLQAPPQAYELMVIDPPAFAKNLRTRHNAIQGYKRLNALALKKLKPGGMLFTFSCSQVVDKPLFDQTILAAAIEAGRPARIMHHLHQPPDHPASIFHPEGQYLKGLALYVE